MSATILAGYDGTPQAGAALRFARRVATATGARLLVACVYSPPISLIPWDPTGMYADTVRRDADATLEGAHHLLAGMPAVETCTVCAGSPAQGLYELAERKRPELCIVGSS